MVVVEEEGNRYDSGQWTGWGLFRSEVTDALFAMDLEAADGGVRVVTRSLGNREKKIK